MEREDRDTLRDKLVAGARRGGSAHMELSSALLFAAIGQAIVETSDADLEQLERAGGLRWHTHGYLFTVELSLEGNWFVGLEPMVSGGACLKIFEPSDALFAPEVYDFPRAVDAIRCALDMVVHRLVRPRVTHRWYRRAVYGQEPTRRAQFLEPPAGLAPLPEALEAEE